jgi:predicted amidohydrolase
MKVRVALVQFDSIPERVDRNLGEMERLVRGAAEEGARWVVFHEGTVADYTPRLDELAEQVPQGRSTQRMLRLAAKFDLKISFGLSETDHGMYYITQVFVGPEGLLHRYRKTWLWRSENDEGYRNEWARYDPGQGPEPFSIDGIKATCFICADGEAPRCIQRAALLRPSVIFYPNNRGSLPDLPVFAERAKAIGAPMLVANRVGKSWTHECKGGCVAYTADGSVVAKANRDGREETLLLDLPIV